jgi:hypothetical protein
MLPSLASVFTSALMRTGNCCFCCRNEDRLSSSNFLAWSRSPRAQGVDQIAGEESRAGGVAELPGYGEGLLAQAHRQVVVSAMVGHGPELAQRAMSASSMTKCPVEGEALPIQLGRAVVVPVSGLQDAGHEQRERPPALLTLGTSQRHYGLQPPAALAQLTCAPETPQRQRGAAAAVALVEAGHEGET